ncbi:zinc-dependent alcohol dehydrogenase family protein [Sphingomonas immobilis]|uniref:NAD(P)-dependent alcohol dehydrogenase n=1 Tax=Sphingomonas immobilis TaxID=3063997 RepID=A0ABT8ZX69_9SPHN|nr:NAD(P)-dependent alcohol dehydrogenase [Sphingomonas sp. CA1-15]MDO7842161.1 NAD(P)-dependent alcohol dehydrogenase [Sphingomonas sp. CA1-15]
MKAIQLRHPATLDTLALVDLPDAPAPGPGEITVRLRASSLNYHDYAVVTGGIPAAENRIPMSDGAGEVTAVGDGVTDFAVGDAVVSLFFPNWIAGQRRGGGFDSVPGDGIDGYARESVTRAASAFTRAPRGFSHAEAATLTCAGLTAWRALVAEGHLKAGDTVLVQGTGGVSIFALQIAKAMGATVVATSSSDEKLERLKALGADHLVNYRTTEKWGKAVLGLTGGVGVDHVVEIGGSGTLDQSMIAARSGGHIAMIGVLSGYKSPVTTSMLMQKELLVQGITVGSRRHQLDFIAAVEATGIRPVLDRSFALADLAGAFRHQESGAHFGKIIVDI